MDQPDLFPKRGPAPLRVEQAPARERPLGVPPAGHKPVQLALFSDRATLDAALDDALGNADFAAARRIRDEIGRDHGASAVTGLEPLDEIAPDFWERPLSAAERLAAFERLARGLAGNPRRLRRLRRGFFERLFALHEPDDLLDAGPRRLPLLVNALDDLGRREDARRLVRDALLAGVSCRPERFEDAELAAILAERAEPRWLASLGAIRRAWPLPAPGAAELAALVDELDEPEPEQRGARALAFWNTLRVAQLDTVLDPRVIEKARARLRRLNPRLHAGLIAG